MELHIGNEIKRVLEEKGIKPEFVAQRISTSVRNFYDILTREEISTGQLSQISKALDYDFFSLYQHDLDMAKEHDMGYVKRAKVVVSVELDGLETTLREWVTRLTKINSVIS